MATLNLAVSGRLAMAMFFACLAADLVVAEDSASLTNIFAATAKRVHAEARERWQQDSNNVEFSWQLGRACYDHADYATNNAERAALAEEGMAACRHAIRLDANLAPARYYLALNTGQLARTKLFTALYLVGQLEESMLASIALDPAFDFAGAHRAIGVLYRDAPGWPTSVGNRAKSRLHLEKAVELFPDFPANRITFLESLLEWGDKKTVRAQLAAVEEVLKAARLKLTGEVWDPSWEEWDRRWQNLQAKVSVEPAKSPRSNQ